jgi:hypothetical protein
VRGLVLAVALLAGCGGDTESESLAGDAGGAVADARAVVPDAAGVDGGDANQPCVDFQQEWPLSRYLVSHVVDVSDSMGIAMAGTDESPLQVVQAALLRTLFGDYAGLAWFPDGRGCFSESNAVGVGLKTETHRERVDGALEALTTQGDGAPLLDALRFAYDQLQAAQPLKQASALQRGSVGVMSSWQDGVPMLRANVSQLADYPGTRLTRAHWGMYAGSTASQGVQYNDDIQLWQLAAPITDFETEPDCFLAPWRPSCASRASCSSLCSPKTYACRAADDSLESSPHYSPTQDGVPRSEANSAPDCVPAPRSQTCSLLRRPAREMAAKARGAGCDRQGGGVPVHALPCGQHAPRSAPPAALRLRFRYSRTRVRSVPVLGAPCWAPPPAARSGWRGGLSGA